MVTITASSQHAMLKSQTSQQLESPSSSNGTSKTAASSPLAQSITDDLRSGHSSSTKPTNSDSSSPHFGPISTSNVALLHTSPSLGSLDGKSRTSAPARKMFQLQDIDCPSDLNFFSPTSIDQGYYNGFQQNRLTTRKLSSNDSFDGNSLRANGSVAACRIYSAIGSLEQYSYEGNRLSISKGRSTSGRTNDFTRGMHIQEVESFSPPGHVRDGQSGPLSTVSTNANLNHQFVQHPRYRSDFLPNNNTGEEAVNCDFKPVCLNENKCRQSSNQHTGEQRQCDAQKGLDSTFTSNTKFDNLISKPHDNQILLFDKNKSGNLDKQLNMREQSMTSEKSIIKSSSMSQFDKKPPDGFLREKSNIKPKRKKKVTVNKVPTETFRPSCDAYTPRVKSKKIDYKPAQERASNAMSTTMGTISRPNFRDALRRVAMIIQQHIVKIERRNEERPFSSTRNGLFNKKMMDMFSEDNFVSPRYKYTMVRLPMARPGVICSVRNIKPTYEIPMEDEIYEFAHQLFKVVQLSSECSIVCLIYVERLMEVAKVPLMARTWRPIVMCGLLLASKVWQDLSSWNIEFASVYPQFSLDSINKLELLFLRQVKWDLYISSSLYAKYYFALRSLLEKKDFRVQYNRMVGASGRIDMSQAMEIQKRTERVKEESLNQLSQSV